MEIKVGDSVGIEGYGDAVVFGWSERILWVCSERGVTPIPDISKVISHKTGDKGNIKYEKAFKVLINAMTDMYFENASFENKTWYYMGLVEDICKELDLTDIKNKKDFTKDDLKSWVVVQLRNGVFFKYFKTDQVGAHKNGWLYGIDKKSESLIEIIMDTYTDDLKHVANSDLDIIGLYMVKNHFDLNYDFEYTLDNLELITSKD